MFTKRLEFGNFTLLFGEKKVMLDHFLDIVMPSFHEMKYKRELKNSDFFFLDTELVVLDESDINNPVIGLKGRIVKNTMLKREQIFTGGSLIDNKKELESAPSSSFLLILNNHRLVFCKEVTGAPTVGNFKSTCQSFLNKRHNEYINEQYSKRKKDKVTKVELRIETPQPLLRITPLASSEELEEFILRFSHINDISIKLLTTNNEDINNDSFWKALDESKNEMNSKNVKVQYTNNEDGLKSDIVCEEINHASSLGNSEITLNGKDSFGDKIRGNNNDFKLTVPVKSYTKDIKEFVFIKYKEFLELVSNNIIVSPSIEEKTMNKVRSLHTKVFKNE